MQNVVLKSFIAIAAIVGCEGLLTKSTSAQEWASVSYVNESNMTVKLGVKMINGKYRWDDLKPGEKGQTIIQWFPYQTAIGFAIQTADGRIRVGSVRVRTTYVFNRPYGLVNAKVIRRSPGVPGIVDAL